MSYLLFRLEFDLAFGLDSDFVFGDGLSALLNSSIKFLHCGCS